MPAKKPIKNRVPKPVKKATGGTKLVPLGIEHVFALKDDIDKLVMQVYELRQEIGRYHRAINLTHANVLTEIAGVRKKIETFVGNEPNNEPANDGPSKDLEV
jgi:hypothetical protein